MRELRGRVVRRSQFAVVRQGDRRDAAEGVVKERLLEGMIFKERRRSLEEGIGCTIVLEGCPVGLLYGVEGELSCPGEGSSAEVVVSGLDEAGVVEEEGDVSSEVVSLGVVAGFAVEDAGGEALGVVRLSCPEVGDAVE